MVVKNEEQLIGSSIRSVRGVADEIVVVDSGSTDRTVEIAKALGARIIHYQWDGSLGRARNAYLSAARGNWVLVLDGDETISRLDLAKIKSLIRKRSMIGYRLTVRNYTEDHDLIWNWYPNDRSYPREERFSSCPGWVKTQPLRLFRNFPGLAYVEGSSVHTSPMASLRKHSGQIKSRDDVVIHHFQHLKGGGQFLSGKQQLRLKGEVLHSQQFPDEPHTYLNIAKTLFATKRDKEAIKYLSKAIKLDDTFHDAYQLWAMIDLENGRLPSAEERLKRAIQIDQNSADAWALLGVVLAEGGRPHEGIHALRNAVQLRPGHLIAHNSLGVVYEDLGMDKEARREYRAAIKLHPRFGPARVKLARLVGVVDKPRGSRVKGQR
jgi:glycosyltransferase involved in cell wall biosynthesis